MSPVPNLKTSLACTLIFSLFITGLLTLTTGQSHAANNSLPHSLTSTVNESSEKTVPQTQTVDEVTRSRLSEAYGELSIRFEANQGQFDRQAQFLARGGGYSLFLTSSEVVMVLTKPPANKDRVPIRRSPFALPPAKNIRGERENRDAKATGRAKGIKVAAPESAVLRMKLEGANPSTQAEGLDELPGKTNYFIGNDPHKWHTDIPSYARVMYRDVYPGVDLLYYGREQQLEYDFRVAPGVDPAKIKLNFEGAQSINIDAQGDLVLHTEVGDVHQHKPAVYQEVDGAKREIPSRYEMKDSRSVGFHVDAYDINKPLVIDPILLYSTFLGGSSETEGDGIAIDAAGNAYVVGYTYGFDFPVGNPGQVVGGYGSFVAKLNGDGSALIYSTFIGGTGFSSRIAVDLEGSAYITGWAYAPDFPVVNAVQTTPGGVVDAFVTKLSPQGSALFYSTYLGGANYEEGEGIAVDDAGNAYVTGLTFSQDFPVVNSFQSTKAGHQAYRSNNSGGHWSASDSGLNAAMMNDLVIDPAHPSTLYSATDQGVFKSLNGGNTWHAANRGIDTSLGYAERLAIDPLHTSTVYLVADYGILKSTNGGNTWAPILPSGYSQTIAIDPVNTSTIYASAFNPRTGRYGVVFKSTDEGGTWKARGIRGHYGYEAPVASLAVDPTNNSIVYAGTANAGVYKSTDGGGRWVSVTRGQLGYLYIKDLALDPSNSSIIYASTYEGIYKSTDGGGHWQAINDGLPAPQPFLEIPTLAIDPVHPSVVYAGTAESGLFKTTDGGAHWSAASAGLTNRVVQAVAINPSDTSKVYVATNSMADVFVAKLNPSGSSLAYSTYLGGNEDDQGYGIALDSDGHAFLTGWTISSNFPVKNPLQPSLRAYSDAFVTKMDATGSSLTYSTYLGGADYESGNGIAADASGNAYVVGWTQSADFPLTPGTFQTDLKGYGDAFVTKINTAGDGFVYSTYLGGDGGVEYGYAIAVNSSGQAFVTGQTNSFDFPLANATQSSFHGDNDVFVTRLNAAGSSLVFSTYLGGSGYNSYEEGRGIAVDAANNIYVTGTTNALNFPVTPNAFKRHIKYAGAFVTKIGKPPASIRISGRVLLNKDGLGGVTVTLKNGAGAVLQTTMTQSDGSYSFNAPGGGDYTVTPSKPGQTFNPPSLSYTKVGTDLPMQNFKASTIIIRVQVLDIYGNGLQNVRVALSGSRAAICITRYTGLCGFSGLSTVGRYTITSSTGDTTFNPPSRTIINPSEDQTVTFKAAFSISGRITGFNGIGIGGVTLALSGDRRTFTTTDKDGNYKFTNLPAGGHYTVTPSRGGIMLNPTYAEFYYLNAPLTADFQALVSITGKVRLQGTTSGISSVPVILTGLSYAFSTTTDSDGIYTFTYLPAGGTYTVRPVIIGYTFSPSFRTFTDLRVSQGFRTSYFDGTP